MHKLVNLTHVQKAIIVAASINFLLRYKTKNVYNSLSYKKNNA